MRKQEERMDGARGALTLRASSREPEGF
jgi:hypothetical protein